MAASTDEEPALGSVPRPCQKSYGPVRVATGRGGMPGKLLILYLPLTKMKCSQQGSGRERASETLDVVFNRVDQLLPVCPPG